MSQQVKVPADVKREVELCAAVTGRTQGQLLAEAWREYREHHKADFAEGLRWAASVLGQPAVAATHASGMAAEELDELRQALDEPSGSD